MAEGQGRLLGVLIVTLAVLGATTLGGADDGGGAYIESSAPAMVPAGQAGAEVTTTAIAVEPSTTSAGPATSTPRLVSAAAVTTTTAPAPAATSTTTALGPPPPPATTTTTVACRNSSDPACGPFRFDPQPGPDNPMFVHIVVGPPSPVAGQAVEFTVTLTDPDGVSRAGSTYNWGDSGIGESSVDPCEKYGPWDPPARDPARATEVLTLRHTYAQPGTYKVVFFFTGDPFDCVDSVTGRGDRPYASSASGTVTIEVR